MANNLSKPRLFIVEDEAIIVSDLEARLTRLDYQVVGTAAGGERALALVEQVQPDLVLMDLCLAGPMDGIEVAREMQARFRLPVVFLTAHAEEATLQRAQAAKPFGFVLKPCEDRELKIILEMAIYKHRTEAELWESKRFLSDVLDAVPVRVFWKDRDSRLLGCNRPFAQDAGFASPDELIGKSDSELGWPEIYRADDRMVIESGIPKIGFEEPQTAPDGSQIWLRTSKMPLRDAAGAVIGVLGTYEDFTERKRAEQALVQSENELRLLWENSQDGMRLTDGDGIVCRVNDAYCRLVAQPREALVGKCMMIVFAASRQARMLASYRRKFRTRGILPHTASQVILWDGRVLQLELSNSFLVLPGQPEMMFSIFRDVTERKRSEEKHLRLEAQLQQAQKMESVGRLAGGVAHDFNNMLQAILGNVHLALEQASPSGELRDSLQEIQQAAQRSADLTRQLLAFARKQTVAPRILDLNDTLAGMLKMLQRLIGEDIQLAWLPGKDLWPVKVDPSQLDQMLANLTVNARDAIAGVGKITIETANAIFDDTYVQTHADGAAGDYVQFAVSDTGCGMKPEIQCHLFEPFFTTKGVGEGTGLGLATVYGIVKQNGGFIEVSSQPGQGTTFRICLPRAEAPAVAAAVVEDKPALCGTETVLLVEDEAQILNLGRRILEQHGYTVLTAGTPEEALHRVARHPGSIHLLITDVVMPGMNGRILRDRIADLKSGLRCLFISGYTANVIAHHGVLEDNVHFLQKPFTIEALTRKVREVLDANR